MAWPRWHGMPRSVRAPRPRIRRAKNAAPCQNTRVEACPVSARQCSLLTRGLLVMAPPTIGHGVFQVLGELTPLLGCRPTTVSLTASFPLLPTTLRCRKKTMRGIGVWAAWARRADARPVQRWSRPEGLRCDRPWPFAFQSWKGELHSPSAHAGHAGWNPRPAAAAGPL